MQVLLYNAQSWTKLTSKNINKVQTIQLKYLKRMMHAPISTSNTITFLETGTTPIEYQIHIKQLIFLYHILQLKPENTVKLVYYQQHEYPSEQNWANNIRAIRQKYTIAEEDETIKEMSSYKWKS